MRGANSRAVWLMMHSYRVACAHLAHLVTAWAELKRSLALDSLTLSMFALISP